MNEDLNIAFKVCCALIGNKLIATDSEIDSAIHNTQKIYPDTDPFLLKRLLLAKYCVSVDNFQVLEGRERRAPWLSTFKQTHTKWDFWKRYKEYLDEDKNFSPAAINQIDKLTDNVLDKLFDPNMEHVEICKKGLVVGQVQSGKTANYTGLICKAADAGFNMIIVLAGILNNLRSQTQARLDEGFLGFDTQYERAHSRAGLNKIGVGLHSEADRTIANSMTTSMENGDFSKKFANQLGINFATPQPFLFVVKKNASVLKNLDKWLGAQMVNNTKIDSKSVLIIDDEADNASVNTAKKDQDPTSINNCIRKIISKFNRVAYVGYTATPFANIFIAQDEDKDLFPKDFIINIPAPSNYVGPEKVFGTSVDDVDDSTPTLPIVIPITDYANFVPDRHRKDDPKPDYTDIPESLSTAIKAFIVTCAIRIARGQGNKHNSMLIHVSRFQSWQNHIKNLVERKFEYYKQEIEAEDSHVMSEFHDMLENDSSTYKSFKTITQEILDSPFHDIDNQLKVHKWDEIRPLLYQAVQKIEVKSINGSSADVLGYDNAPNGISVIAIGGDKLSRGLTLEGLSVSYFLRASTMYDTLMQMGRWFGYRPGYIDLCRLYTSPELNEWYRHITMASEELRAEFNYLAETGGTPDQYALKVRTHPGRLQITSVGKMRNVDRIRVSWAGRLVETYQLPLSRKDKHQNMVATENFLAKLQNGTSLNNNRGFLWRDVKADVVCDFLQSFKVAENLKMVDLEKICEYIEALSSQGELTNWSIALLSSNKSGAVEHQLGNYRVKCFFRRQALDTDGRSYYIRKNHIVGNQADEFVDLDSDVLKSALEETKRMKEGHGLTWNKPYPSPNVVRSKYRDKTNPLLLIYPLDASGANDKRLTFSSQEEPFIGFAISFPMSDNHDAGVDYVVNRIKDYAETEDYFENNNDNID